MSIEIHVFPTIDRRTTTAELDMSVRSMLGHRLNTVNLPDNIIVGQSPDGELKIGDSCKITLGRSLFLYMWPNDENQLYFLEGQAKNVSQADLETIANRNELVGYHYNLDSKMGRTEVECLAMLSTAASLAKFTNGLVLLADHAIQNVPRGGYSWEQIVEKIGSYDGNPIEPTMKRSLPSETENELN